MPLSDFLLKKKTKKKEETPDVQGIPKEEDLECYRLRKTPNVEEILQKPELRDAFVSYLEWRDGSVDRLNFWLEIRAFKSCFLDEKETEENSNSDPTPVALGIYRKYVSPEGSLTLSPEVSLRTVQGLCTEKGQTDPDCFDLAQEEIYTSLNHGYFSDFLRSQHYAQYLLDEGRHQSFSIRDVLSNQTLLFHFTEFVEAEGVKDFLSFWMMVDNFHDQEESLQADALAIYERFISMQASNPLGFSDKIRSQIEERICAASGSISPHLFDDALKIVARTLHTKYLNSFLRSSLFQNYVAELKSTIYGGTPSKSSTKSLLSGRRSTSISSIASASSDISTQNTLLAMSRPLSKIPKSKSDINGKILRNIDSHSINMDISWDPNNIWSTMPLSTSRTNNIGSIDHLGRYISYYESPPSANSSNHSNDNHHSPSFSRDPLINNNFNSKFNRVMRVLGVSNEVPLDQEQLAWQKAEMIVKSITNLTSSNGENNDQR